MAKKQQKNRRRKVHMGRLFACIGIVVCLCAGTLYSIHIYTQPELYGKWQSEETKKVVKFNKDGTVWLEEKSTQPTFELLTRNKLSYTIEGKMFEMYYDLDGRTLEWGMTEESVETFKRK